jgi:hypothetical protein
MGANGMAVVGNHGYIGSEWGLRVIDITDPSNPVQVGLVDDFRTGEIVAASGSLIYRKSQPREPDPSHLTVLDVSDPLNPKPSASTRQPRGPMACQPRRISPMPLIPRRLGS